MELYDKRFAIRSNPDRTFDSICMHCFRTVATSSSIVELHALERNHVCDRDLIKESNFRFFPSLGRQARAGCDTSHILRHR